MPKMHDPRHPPPGPPRSSTVVLVGFLLTSTGSAVGGGIGILTALLGWWLWIHVLLRWIRERRQPRPLLLLWGLLLTVLGGFSWWELHPLVLVPGPLLLLLLLLWLFFSKGSKVSWPDDHPPPPPPGRQRSGAGALPGLLFLWMGLYLITETSAGTTNSVELFIQRPVSTSLVLLGWLLLLLWVRALSASRWRR